MKAQVLRQYGPEAHFELTDIPEPQIRPGHVILHVKATSLNPLDSKIRRLGLPLAPDLPAVLHGDVAGIVKEVGEGVTGIQVGDAVYGCAGGVKGHGGALAEYMVVDAQLIAPKPRSLDFLQAAALPLVSLTAWEGLIDRAHVQPEQTVLIHGAAGGVGHIALQIAVIKDASVFATISSKEKGDLGSRLGAKEVIYYREESPEAYVKRLTKGKGFDIVFDTVGGPNIDQSFLAAANHGQVITIVSMSSHDLTPMHLRGLTLHVVFQPLPLLTGKGRAHHGHILRQIARWVDEGKLTPLVDPIHFTLKDVNAAHEYFESGKHKGKIVIEVS